MQPIRFTTAITTPLTEDELLHKEGLEAQLDLQCKAGVSGILVGGTMGIMQFLRDDVYRDLVDHTLAQLGGRLEVFVGAGDTGFARTRDRIDFLNRYPLDGVVVLPPFFLPFRQEELIDYYEQLAEMSRAPLYLYDQPAVAGAKLGLDTVLALAKHPNIRGIKCGDPPAYTRQLIDHVDDSFRVFSAQPDLIDTLVRHGVRDHLDGVFAIVPEWPVAIGRCAERDDWSNAAEYQRNLSQLRRLIVQLGVFPATTALLNARGIPGCYAPRPYRPLTEQDRQALLAKPVVQKLLRSASSEEKP